MWVKLGNEYLNLNHVTRVRFSKGWKNGQEELVAEIEVVINGTIQALMRYRGREADTLQAALGEASVADPVKAAAGGEPIPAIPRAGATTHRDTLHDI